MKYEDWAQWAIKSIDRAKKSGGKLTAGLVGLTAQKRFKADPFILEKWLSQLRDEGRAAVANGRWYLR